MTAATDSDSLPADTHADASASVAALVDDPQFWSAFGKALPDGTWESRLAIEGMYCAACALNIEDALRGLPGVEEVSVSLGSQRARVRWIPASAGDAGAARPSQWLDAVKRAGYRAVPAQDIFASERRRHESRGALWRWLVALFCMMQVMMYAWPAYANALAADDPMTAITGGLSGEVEQLLRWASWVLALPVMLFSCGPFFKAALRDLNPRRLLTGRISMDLPVALGMAITFIVSTLGTFEPDGSFGREVYFDSLTMFVAFLLTGRWLETRLRNKTAGALDALMNRLPESVLRQRKDGTFERIAVHRVKAGDVLRVLPGEAFAADGVIIEGHTQVDEALLTGESKPLTRDAQGLDAQVIAGSHNLSAPVLMRVARAGKDTRYAQIVALMEQAESSRPHLAQLVDRLARPFLIGVLLAAALAALYWWHAQPDDPGHALMVAVAVLVVTCPCALSLATPAAMLAAAGTLAKRGVLVRRLSALEALEHADVVVFDKTGTLTSDALTLQAVHTREGISREQALAWGAALAQHSLHPLSRALFKALPDAAPAQDAQELHGLGLTGRVEGKTLKLGSAAHCRVDEPGLHAGPRTMLADEQGWLATFEFDEALRPDAVETVKALQGLGLRVMMLSGDQPVAVMNAAKALGLSAADARGACAPQDKLDALKALQQQGHRVIVVGDGLNDGPALAGAQASFAFGPAVPLARAQADFVVLGDQLASVALALQVARRAMRIVRQNIAWAVLYNAACIPLAVAGWLPAWAAGLGMALSSLLVVLNALRLSGMSRLAPDNESIVKDKTHGHSVSAHPAVGGAGVLRARGSVVGH